MQLCVNPANNQGAESKSLPVQQNIAPATIII
jgi:hypothetical protein